MTEQLLTVTQAADRLAVSRWSVYRLFEAGELKGVRVGRARRVAASDLEQYIQRLRDAA